MTFGLLLSLLFVKVLFINFTKIKDVVMMIIHIFVLKRLSKTIFLQPLQICKDKGKVIFHLLVSFKFYCKGDL